MRIRERPLTGLENIEIEHVRLFRTNLERSSGLVVIGIKMTFGLSEKV